MPSFTKSSRPCRAALISLGCAKNLVDSEVMLGSLLAAGIEVTNSRSRADVVIVNTCAFIDAAKSESIDAILDCVASRDSRRQEQAIVVAGCLPQRFRDALPGLFPEIDAFVGVDQIAQIADIVLRALAVRGSGYRQKRRGILGMVQVTASPVYVLDSNTPRFLLTPRHYAYVKIAEGCGHSCAFCSIPRIRGRQRSRPPQDIAVEARRMVDEGVKELNLIAQDTTAYGKDLSHRVSRSRDAAGAASESHARRGNPAAALSVLLESLNDLEGDFWIRLLYTHPANWNDELISAIARCRKVVRYVDIPLQHSHNDILRRMRRETPSEYLAELLQRIRAGIPGVALRTTFIVGFPGETDRHFESLIEFIHAARFERLGVFTYSQEEGTAASRMPGQIPEKVKRGRRDRLLSEQRIVAREIAASSVGKRIRVLLEGAVDRNALDQDRVFFDEHGLSRAQATATFSLANRTWLAARGEMDAPEVDGRVYVRGKSPTGDFAHVRVIGHSDYDLVAELE